ncbi:MAG TPA: sugar-binding transcriptional regulator [Aggregatilineales bacterium]|nr:sugar-binding transcriptional regulator [Aggregatilineales bacterium]
MGDDIRLLVRVATLYYKNQYSQQEIAQHLGITRQTVAKFLQRAHDLGIVRIEIQSPLSYATQLELALEQDFQLLEAVVVIPPADTEDAIKECIGEATAEFVSNHIKNGDVLGVVSGSTTLHQFALHLKPARIQNLTIVALTGSAPHTPSPADGESIVRQVAQAFGANLVTLPAPSFVDRPDIKTSLLSDSNIAAVLNLAHQANIAVFGIGTISEESSPYKYGYVDDNMLEAVRAAGGVGEICGHAYDLNGNLCSPESSARAIAIDLYTLRAKPLAIAAAGGLRKSDAILGALQGKFCNVLVTDQATASNLLERKKALPSN